jgi:hypothetical protein
MRRYLPHIAAAAVVFAAAGLFALLAPPRAEAATPPADVTAYYMGKGWAKNNVIGDEEPGKDKLLFLVLATQTGNDLTLSVTILDADGGFIETVNMTGRVGNGNFWATGDMADGGALVIWGTAKGVPGKLSLKGKGVYLGQENTSDIAFKVKEYVGVM